MIRLLPSAIALALVIFSLIDCVQSDVRRVRNLPKWAWLVLIVLIPIAGPITWLLGGRPHQGHRWPRGFVADNEDGQLSPVRAATATA